ncbi:E2/E3 hybrid ubiquitin-protein ligase ube2o [Parelaphostrongylus tenuis]|uniref:E2/E3 hybrid ubiquitin-protein ligase ube2o n=1 Tax=Parelaphostrongylus tenuis TaxID=148309 RepID=A0AAD5LZI2_PARTN|nr:E2/E3 hybrid ubiquitin-protein ligase ube2o [Parelaphostrongylus tenuis]
MESRKKLWPFDIVPLQYLDDSLESDDEDEMSTSEADQSEHISLFSVTLDEVREVLCRLGFSYSGTSNQPNVICEEEVIAVSKHLLEYYPPLENFTKEISPEDDDARNVEIFFAGVMLEASGEKCNELSKPLVQFAALMANAYRSRLLPECFDIQLLSVLVDGYTSGSVSFRNSRFNKEGDELAFSLNESINNARRYPEWLPIFHCISELFRGCYENSLRITLRSVFYMFDRTYFFPRYLSWEYVMFLNNTIRMASQIVDNDSGCVPIQKCVYWTTGEKHSFDKLPRITLISEASTRKIDLTMFAITLMAQIMDCEKQPVENISLLVGDEVAFVDFLESVPNMSLHSAINVTFAAALVLLTRCGILCQTASSDGFCVWKNLNFFFSYSYNPPVQVKYTVLHEIITFVRSVDFLTPALLQRLTEFTQSHSFEAVYNYVEHALDEKSKESENICETPCDPPNSEESASPTNDDRNGNIEGTFQVIDEFIDTVPNDVSDIPVGNKFYMTLYKEHKMLAKNMPDNIHVHAFANRLDVLHVLIIGPAGTPFETTPFFFKFKLPYDYPERPPNVTYVAYSQEQLNPNLYQNGKVCTSLLGTWSGKGVETWDPKKSNLLQVLLSIQALILVPEPYFNEAGYENRKLQSEMGDKSRRYNETAAINSLEYLHKIYMEPPTDFKNIIREFVRKSWPLLHRRISDWISGSASPSFPVMNSEGFKVALKKMACKITTTINAQEGEQTENAESLEVPEAVQSVST